MRAVIWTELDAQPEVRDDLAEPTAGTGQVLVRVHASSVNPMDGALVAGMLKDMAPHEFPVTLGRDFAGVVEAIGDGVTSVSVGNEVLGEVPPMPPVRDGAWAELIAVSEQVLVRKPDGVDTTTAGAAPLALNTAILLIDAVELNQGQSVLIVGATGGVGSLAVQLAAATGATVIAPARPVDEEFLRDLGVAEIVARDGDVTATVRERHADGVDAIVDLVTRGAAGAYDAALKDGGRVSSPTNAAGDGPGRTNVMHAPNHEVLGRVADLLAEGTVKVPVQETYDLDRAAEAMQALGTGHTQGKIALRVS